MELKPMTVLLWAMIAGGDRRNPCPYRADGFGGGDDGRSDALRRMPGNDRSCHARVQVDRSALLAEVGRLRADAVRVAVGDTVMAGERWTGGDAGPQAGSTEDRG